MIFFRVMCCQLKTIVYICTQETNIKRKNMKRVNTKQTPVLKSMIRKHKAWTKEKSLSPIKIGNKVTIDVKSGYYVAYNLEEGC